MGAIRICYQALTGEPSRLNSLDVKYTVISDTLMFYSTAINANTFIALSGIYHILVAELGKIGLSLRGAMSFGGLRIRSDEPRTIIGDVIVKCATIESETDAFAVGVDNAFVDYLLSLDRNTLEYGFLSFISPEVLPTKTGDREMYVLKWYIPVVPFSICRVCDSIFQRIESGDISAEMELAQFVRKFRNSQTLFSTVVWKDEKELFDIASQKWNATIDKINEYYCSRENETKSY